MISQFRSHSRSALNPAIAPSAYGEFEVQAVSSHIGLFDRGMNGGVLNIEGRQYIHVSNVMKGLGKSAAASIFKAYDTPTRKIIESIDLKSYIPAEKPDPMRGLMWKSMKYMGRVIPATIRGLRNPDEAEQQYNTIFAQDVVWSKQLATQDILFRDLVDQLIDRFSKQLDVMFSVQTPSLLGRQRLQGIFKKDDVEDLLVALEMDLNGNPNGEMGRKMVALAQFPEVQETETGEEFAAKLAANEFSPEFTQAYDEYMEKFGCRTIREIDIAIERPYENMPEFFKQLKALEIDNGLLANVAKRRAAAYEQLLALQRKKEKRRNSESKRHCKIMPAIVKRSNISSSSHSI